ncbi:hypothetical protein KGM_210164 [Danaus plexippus plexippus]|uniref:Uncharacterized protein n=1 Tax=Danaus plexippus plexippus TaxID=278856 RepID=A0A212EMI7_DANPL|nr:hypothetical protein KGM_210164 [Danaus plexippus plexippus]
MYSSAAFRMRGPSTENEFGNPMQKTYVCGQRKQSTARRNSTSQRLLRPLRNCVLLGYSI